MAITCIDEPVGQYRTVRRRQVASSPKPLRARQGADVSMDFDFGALPVLYRKGRELPNHALGRVKSDLRVTLV
eukprot:386703-Rhodomonas_salina.1